MADIDQIAENADNLISILQSIKQRNQQRKASESNTAPVPAPPVEEAGAAASANEGSPTPWAKKADDFWDNHTHSPP